jgi:hypothetical protein
VLAISPALEAPMKRAVSRRVRLKEQTLKIGPLSGRQNVGPCQHHALKNTEPDVIDGREDDSTIAGEQDKHWGRGERSFGHG